MHTLVASIAIRLGMIAMVFATVVVWMMGFPAWWSILRQRQVQACLYRPPIKAAPRWRASTGEIRHRRA